jgi:hypothetical protein
MTKWTNTEAWLARVAEHRNAEESAVAERIVAWADERGLKHRGQGNDHDTKGITYTPIIPSIDWDPVPFHVTSRTGRVGLEGSSVGGKGRRPYGNESSFQRLLTPVKSVPRRLAGQGHVPGHRTRRVGRRCHVRGVLRRDGRDRATGTPREHLTASTAQVARSFRR